MNDVAPVFSLSIAAALFVASVAGATLGRGQARRGLALWLVANGVLAAGLVAQGLAGSFVAARPLAMVLVLLWPVLTLCGLRRFFARAAGAVPAWVDWAAFTTATLVSLGSWAAPFDFATPSQMFALAHLGLTAYAGFACHRLDDAATTSTLRILVGASTASAVAQAGWIAGALGGLLPTASANVSWAAFAAAAIMGLLLTQLALVLDHERNVAHLRESHRKLRHLVDVDPLTRLPNRRHFHQLAARAIRQAPELATVLVFDVERLAHINEVLGHANGDEALRQIGNVLRESLRRRDVAGRLGGDEFAVVLPRTRVADAANAIARINARLDDRQVAPRIAQVRLQVGSTQMQVGETVADALRRAEIALGASRDAALAGQQAAATQPMPAPSMAAAARATDDEPGFLSGFGGIPVGEVSMVAVTS